MKGQAKLHKDQIDVAEIETGADDVAEEGSRDVEALEVDAEKGPQKDEKDDEGPAGSSSCGHRLTP